MRIVRFVRNNGVYWGTIRDDLVYGLSESPFETFEAGAPFAHKEESYPLNSVKLIAPCLPSKIVCLGVNYLPHAEEFNSKLPSNPLIFIKPPPLCRAGRSIVLPRNWKRVDFEAELA
jgi:2-keto-4-pentenoate hydratase/2-oxohepta-3-ene-1,7-dioic acid hydratase in catechol pathway